MRRALRKVIGTSLVLGLVACRAHILLGDASTSGGDTTSVGGSIAIEAGTSTAGASFTVGSCSFPFDARNTWLLFDSDAVAFNRDVYAMRADGSALLRLTTDSSDEENPTVSPNGRSLAFVSDRSGAYQIYVEDLATGALAQLTTIPAGADQPSWSSDSSQIVFHSGASVWIMAADGSGQRIVATSQYGGYHYPALSLDGAQVVFDEDSHIYSEHIDGTGQQLFVNGPDRLVETPAVSPDGLLVAYAVECFAPEQIAITPFGDPVSMSCLPRRITSTSGWARRPAWGPSRVVAFELRQSGDGRSLAEAGSPGASIAAVVPNASDWCVLVGGPGDNRNPSWAPAGYQPR
jgi:TolB protein